MTDSKLVHFLGETKASLECVRMRDCPGDEARISHLASNTGVKLVGRQQLGRQVADMLSAIQLQRNGPRQENGSTAASLHPVVKTQDAGGIASSASDRKLVIGKEHGMSRAIFPGSVTGGSVLPTGVHAMHVTGALQTNAYNSALGLPQEYQPLAGLQVSPRTQNGY